ncbi:hypothetical protein MCHI_001799 [Candidatus Magnetoovum chiemensis]|nr:hypothetical protein MCHI_001799 [Candidatus Magnetoovum chiemensis]
MYLVSHRVNKKENSYTNDFLKKYYNSIDSDICIIPSIFYFIKTGHLDIKNFDKELKNIFSDKDEKTDPKSLLTGNYWILSDEDFEKAYNGILEDIKQGCLFNQDYYLRLFICFLYYSNQELINLSKKEVLDKFSEGLKLISKNWQYKRIETKLIFTDEPKDEEYTIFKNILFETNEKLKELGNKNKSKELIKLIENDFDKFIDLFGIITVHDSFEIPLFYYWSPSEIYDKILSLNNEKLVKFKQAFEHRYSINNILEKYTSDIDHLEQLKDKLKLYLNNNPEKKLSRSLLAELRATMDKAIESLHSFITKTDI